MLLRVKSAKEAKRAEKAIQYKQFPTNCITSNRNPTSSRTEDTQTAELRSLLCRAQFSCTVDQSRAAALCAGTAVPGPAPTYLEHQVMFCALYSLWNSCTSTAEGEAQTASLGTGAKRKVQLSDYKLVQLENFSRIPKLTSTVKKHIHVGTDLVLCDNTAKMGRQLGCNWIWLCVAKDLSLSESPDLGWDRQHIC